MPRTKRSPRWILYLLSALIVTLSLFTVFGERGGLHLSRLWQEKRRLEEKNFLLQKENETLRERIHRLRHDDRYLERIAREELNLVRPGEIIYRFASSESKHKRSRAISDQADESPPSSGQKSRR
jgi:cell division protein FtsB